MNKLIWLLSVLIFFAALTTILSIHFAVNSGPKLTIDNISYDAGIMQEAGLLKHTFKLRNDGSEPLKILNTQSTCSCVATEVPKQLILPGQTAELPIEVKVATIGRKTEQLLILTNERKEQAQHVVSISVNYQPVAFASSELQNINFGKVTVDIDTEKHLKVFVFSRDFKDIKINCIKSNSEKIQVNQISHTTSEHRTTAGYLRKEFQLNVKVPTDQKGNYNDNIKITFNQQEIPELEIPISWKVKDYWQVTPNKVLFVYDKTTSNSDVKRIEINCSDGKEIESYQIINPDEDLFKINTTLANKSVMLKIELIPNKQIEKSNYHVKLLMKPKEQNEQELKIPIRLISM